MQTQHVEKGTHFLLHGKMCSFFHAELELIKYEFCSRFEVMRDWGPTLLYFCTILDRLGGS